MATDNITASLFGGTMLPEDMQQQLIRQRATEFAQLTPSQQLAQAQYTMSANAGQGLAQAFGVDITDPRIKLQSKLTELSQGIPQTSEGLAELSRRITQAGLPAIFASQAMDKAREVALKETDLSSKTSKVSQTKSRIQALIAKGVAATETEAEAIASDDAAFREAMGLTRTTPAQQLEKQLQDQASRLYPGDTASQVSWINQQKERGKAPTDAEVQDIAEIKQANTLIKSRITDTKKYLEQVSGDNPKVTFGTLSNLAAAAESTGFLGEPSKNTQEQDNIRAYLTSGVNAVLNAAKGVQAKDDAARAKDEIQGYLKLNTNAGARQALERLKKAQEDVLKSNDVYLESRARRTPLPSASNGGTSRVQELMNRLSPEQRKALGL